MTGDEQDDKDRATSFRRFQELIPSCLALDGPPQVAMLPLWINTEPLSRFVH